jgi:hypothetical protein
VAPIPFSIESHFHRSREGHSSFAREPISITSIRRFASHGTLQTRRRSYSPVQIRQRRQHLSHYHLHCQRFYRWRTASALPQRCRYRLGRPRKNRVSCGRAVSNSSRRSPRSHSNR